MSRVAATSRPLGDLALTPVGVQSEAPVHRDDQTAGGSFELLLFTVEPEIVARATAAGTDGFLVDWEHRGKEARQRGADTQINCNTAEDLSRVRGATDARVIVRLSGYSDTARTEIAQAVDRGADEILLPMVRSVPEVEAALEMAAGRAGVGILIETIPAVEHAEALCRLPLSRVYVGLNDLAIQRGSRSIFSAVADGTVETLRRHVRGRFGFGGLTLPEYGSPVPCRLLMGEVMRLGATFTFLRRSFLRDVAGKDWDESLRRIRAALSEAGHRAAPDAERDRSLFVHAVAASTGS